jgi:peptidyl-prolyl cis-trans isomerase A (cyclophilin A)
MILLHGGTKSADRGGCRPFARKPCQGFVAAGMLAVASFAACGADSNRVARVLLETDLGEVLIEVDLARAPATAGNFLRYVEGHFYDGGLFHRTVTASNQPADSVRIAVVQAGANPARAAESFPAISLERTRDTGLRHTNATVSMARAAPDSATSDFFICLGAQPELDFGGRRNPDGQGFAAFGAVIRGMEAVEHIHRAPAEGQKLKPTIRILKARRER